MKKSISLNSGEWCDIVFEGRNKAYGAYELRQSASKRYIAAFFATLLLAIFVAVLPTIAGVVKNIAKGDREIMDGGITMSNIPIDNEVQQENIIKQDLTPPPPPLLTTIRFTAPIITRDEDINESEIMRSQDDLATNNERISIANVVGTTDRNIGVDISDLERHDNIVNAAPEPQKPFIRVQQMPAFPGGEGEMSRFIANNLVYPPVDLETGIQGRVTVRFVVTKTGAISDVTVVRGISPTCDREAIRVVKAMPNWIAGKQNGVAVPVYFTLPIVYRLN